MLPVWKDTNTAGLVRERSSYHICYVEIGDGIKGKTKGRSSPVLEAPMTAFDGSLRSPLSFPNGG